MSSVLDFSFLSIVELEELSSKLEIVKPSKEGVEPDQVSGHRVVVACMASSLALSTMSSRR